MIANTKTITAMAMPALAPSLSPFLSLEEDDEEVVVVVAALVGQEPKYVFWSAVASYTTLLDTTREYWDFCRLLHGAPHRATLVQVEEFVQYPQTFK